MVSKVSAFDNQKLENQLTELTSLVRQLAIGAAYNIEVWTNQGHVGSESSQLSTIGSEVPSTNVLPVTVTTYATARKSFHNGRFSETDVRMQLTISTKHNYHQT
ncbi:hypothetical protein CR513_55600, partial [Mucuna pruriens]